MELLKQTTRHSPKVKVSSFTGLLVDYARQMKAGIIFRGLRAVSDFEFEFQMALVNRTLNPNIEVVFLVPNEKFIFISSSSIKEVAKLGGMLAVLWLLKFKRPCVNAMECDNSPFQVKKSCFC